MKALPAQVATDYSHKHFNSNFFEKTLVAAFVPWLLFLLIYSFAYSKVPPLRNSFLKNSLIGFLC